MYYKKVPHNGQDNKRVVLLQVRKDDIDALYEVYEMLRREVDSTPRHDLLIRLEGANTKVSFGQH